MSNRAPTSRKPGSPGFGQRLKSERIRRGWKLHDFAAAVGCDICQLTAAENRGVTPRFWSIVAMAQVLECSIDYLAGIED